MLANQRHQEILELIRARKYVEVRELSEICKVSTETIRQDLRKLEEEKKLMRVHGGARLYTDRQIEIPYYIREYANTDLKTEIAAEAVNLIRPGEQIILDSSSTCLFLAHALPNLPLTVLTNSIRIAEALVEKDKIQVVVVGGVMLRSSLSFVGMMAQKCLENYKVNKFFLCGKVDYSFGISEPNESAVLVKQNMMKIADEIIVLADHHKFGGIDFMQILPLSKVDHIITDAHISAKALASLHEYSSRVIVAKPIIPPPADEPV